MRWFLFQWMHLDLCQRLYICWKCRSSIDLKLHMDKRLLLNPNIKICRNRHRLVIYEIDDFFHSPDHVNIVSPQDALFLLLFDGSRTYNEVKRDFCKIFHYADEQVDIKSIIDNFTSRYKFSNMLLDSSQMDKNYIEKMGNRYDPLTFLIPKADYCPDTQDLRLDYPLSLNFNVATSCGFACEYCYHPLIPIKPFISFERLKEILKQFKENGCESVMLTGGILFKGQTDRKSVV